MFKYLFKEDKVITLSDHVEGPEGFVYILSNVSMPGLLKIGYSKDVESRVKQLSNTSVPTPFVCEYFLYSEDCIRLEAKVHEIMLRFRVRTNREFFNTSITNAIKCLYEASKYLSLLLYMEEDNNLLRDKYKSLISEEQLLENKLYNN